MTEALSSRLDAGTRRPATPRTSTGRRILIVLTLCWIPILATGQQTDGPPSVVLIVADYMGYADIGPYGADDIRTPALDMLAAGGVRFTDYYAAAPICGPSRAALLSGYYPARVGFEQNVPGDRTVGLPARHGTLVRELETAGYATGLVGKWHLGSGPAFGPIAHGFDTFLGFHTWTIGYHDHRTATGAPGLFRGTRLVDEPGYLTDLFSREAVRFIDVNAGTPFFLSLAYNTALPPYQRPDLPESEWDSGWNVNQATRPDYIAMVEAMDRGIGRVLDALEARGVDENTLVLFTYDHGGRHLVRSDPLFHGFGTLWEGGIRVPLILRWPARVAGGRTIGRSAIAMDLTATILEAAGRGDALPTLDGTSLLEVVTSPDEGSDRALFWRILSLTGPQRAVRRGRWKYLIDGDTQMLFDLDADIGERRDLFRQYPAVARELRAALAAWELSVAAGVPVGPAPQ